MLWPSPGIYAVTTFPDDSLTRAVLRSPELGFLGLVMPTLTHTPFMKGHCFSASAGETAWRAFFPFRQPCSDELLENGLSLEMLRVYSYTQDLHKGGILDRGRGEGSDERLKRGLWR